MEFRRNPGIFEKLVTGANTVLNIANAVQSFRNQGALQEGRELEGIASRLKLAKEAAEITGQPVSTESLAPRLAKQGMSWPVSTPEAQAGMVNKDFQANPPETVGVTQPVPADARIQDPMAGQAVKATPLSLAAGREQQARSTAETVAPIGKPMPILPQGTNVAVMGRSGEITTKNIPGKIQHYYTQPTPEPSNILLDREGKPVQNLGRTKPFFMPKKDETPEEAAAKTAAKTRAKWENTPDIEEIDQETGLPTRTHKRKPFFSKTTENVPVMTEADADKAGKVPKGTRIIKRGESDYKVAEKARSEANKLAEKNPLLNVPGSEKEREEFVRTETDRIFNERKGMAKGGKGQQQSEAPPLNLLKEGHQTEFKNGSVWSLQGGKAVRIR